MYETHHDSGTVTQFTSFAHAQEFASVDRVALSKSLLVTLTYPRSFPTDTSTSRRHFHSFSKRLARTFPTSCAI